jgi:hypothetical protein
MPSPSLAELRSLWRQHGSGTEYDESIRRLITDVVRMRKLIVEMDGLCGAVQRAWRDETRSNLVALERLRILFNDERSRQGGLSSESPPAPAEAMKRYP